MYHKKIKSFGMATLGLALTFATSAWAAKAVDLETQPALSLQASLANSATMKQLSSDIDFNQTTHVRLQQMYSGYPVWGGDVVLHIPHGGAVKNLTELRSLLHNAKTSMNGTIYQELEPDLHSTTATALNPAEVAKVLNYVVELYQKKIGVEIRVKNSIIKLMVYIDEASKAHWVFYITFDAEPASGMVSKPVYIVDAVSMKVYKEWNNLQTLESGSGGGFGGNKKTGKLIYDGLETDLPKLNIQRDGNEKICYLQNDEMRVENRLKGDAVEMYGCNKGNPKHNQVFWDGEQDQVNGGFSPGNDAMYAGTVIKALYQQWYNVPVLTQFGKPMQLVMRVHEDVENAYWDGRTMTFGDGGADFYPLVSLGVGAHEISHGFTEQHSNLNYFGQSGGLNESFSDMAAQAAEFYSAGKNSWQIGAEILKAKHQSLRYMDNPTQDCDGRKPGANCSIDNAKDYTQLIDVHYSSGVFNKMFYLLATSEGWNTKKAFDVMVQANMNYWVSNTNFIHAACGVIKAAKDYNYDLAAVNKAISAVGIETSSCV